MKRVSIQDKKWVVYKHTSPSNKVYIGITSLDPKQRWANGLGYRTQTVMWNAIKKYGWDNFKHEILESDLSYDEAREKEIYYIDKYKSNCRKYYKPTMGYNMDDGGCTGNGHPFSDEAKKKVSNSTYHLAKRKSIDCYDMLGNLTGIYPDLPAILKDYPTIAKTNIVKNCKGIINSLQGFRFFYHEDTNGKEKIEPYSYFIEKKAKNERVVSQYTLDGEYVNTFNTVLEAAKSINADSTKIRKVCNQEQRTFKGFQWVYGSKEENGLFLEPRVYDNYNERVIDGKIVKYKNLTGTHINNLTVLKIAETEEDFKYCKLFNKKTNNKTDNKKRIYWVCRCDCGNIVTVNAENLKSGHTKSCGCNRIKDLTGIVKGNLTVIERDKSIENKEILWRCVCTCGNEVLKPTSYFSNSRKTYMCDECSSKLKSQKLVNVAKRKREQKDLVGLKVGLLTVKHRAEDYVSPKGKRVAKWFCECECGGTNEVTESCLLNGKTLSCGCLNRNSTGKVRVKEDLRNKKFGRWTVLYQGEDRINSKGRHSATWVCQCSCDKGTIKTIPQNCLKSGTSMSCGCLNSELSSERMKKYNSLR